MFINLSLGERRKKNKKIVFKKKDISSFYSYPTSSLVLLKVIRNWIEKRYNKRISPNNISLSLGNRESLFTVFSIFKKKGYLLIPKPYYHIYSKLSKKTIFYNYKNIEKVLENKNILNNIDIVIVNSPNNFNGFFMKKKTLEKLGKLSIKYKFYILSDECYSEIFYKKKPSSFIEIKNNRNAIVINSLSKRSYSPGLRSGFIYSKNKKIINKIKEKKILSGTLPSNFIQNKSIKLWSDEKHVSETRKFYKKNMHTCFNILKKYNKNAKKPKSGFYIWLKLGSKEKVLRTVKELDEKGIRISNGNIFGSEKHIRIALVEKISVCKKAMRIILKKIYE
ncbi:N-succinyl-L L-diaminopimelate aminotransferase alternative [Candidatus Vidania fulgoroideae]|nr:N-succinyl-L L-diaminopimelate aminotransferase alternative [Candidatus Vidania fulgoroideae]